METAVKTQVIFGKLFVLGIVAVGMILGSVFWLTARIDQVEQENAEDLVRLMVTETVSQVEASTTDYAYWNLAYEIVSANDIDAIHEHLGSGATESELFDQLLVLSHDGQILHLFSGAANVMPASQFDLEGIAPFLARLSQYNPSDYVSISGIGQMNGTYGAVAASWITPDYVNELNGMQPPILFGVTLLDDDKLDAIGHLTQGTGYAIRDGSTSAQRPSVELPGPDGTAVAQLIWSPQNLGTILRNEIMPGILLVCLGIFGICVSAARYFHNQSLTLERAHTIATTDQLTGLLNRSGLDEVLRSPSVMPQIEAGNVAIIYLDLNDFKKLNDEHGHEAGDTALQVTSQRLLSSVRATDYAIRLGGDEFICVILDEAPTAAAKLVSDRLLVTCNQPIKLSDHEQVLRPSVGIAIGQQGVGWETLLGQADAAMYSAKRKKLRTPEYFAPPKGTATTRQDKTIAA